MMVDAMTHSILFDDYLNALVRSNLSVEVWAKAARSNLWYEQAMKHMTQEQYRICSEAVDEVEAAVQAKASQVVEE